MRTIRELDTSPNCTSAIALNTLSSLMLHKKNNKDNIWFAKKTLRIVNSNKGKIVKSPFYKIIVNRTNIEKCHDFIDVALFLLELPYKIFYAQLQVS